MTPTTAGPATRGAPAAPSVAGLSSAEPQGQAELSAADRDLAMLAAGACAIGERLQSAANAGMLAVLATGVYSLFAAPAGVRGTPVAAATVLAVAALAVWAWQSLLAARLALDERVFRAFTLGPGERLAPAGFDRALARAGLRRADTPRGMDARWRGARRLLVQQALCVAALALMAMAGLVWIGAHA